MEICSLAFVLPVSSTTNLHCLQIIKSSSGFSSDGRASPKNSHKRTLNNLVNDSLSLAESNVYGVCLGLDRDGISYRILPASRSLFVPIRGALQSFRHGQYCPEVPAVFGATQGTIVPVAFITPVAGPLTKLAVLKSYLSLRTLGSPARPLSFSVRRSAQLCIVAQYGAPVAPPAGDVQGSQVASGENTTEGEELTIEPAETEEILEEIEQSPGVPGVAVGAFAGATVGSIIAVFAAVVWVQKLPRIIERNLPAGQSLAGTLYKLLYKPATVLVCTLSGTFVIESILLAFKSALCEFVRPVRFFGIAAAFAWAVSQIAAVLVSKAVTAVKQQKASVASLRSKIGLPSPPALPKIELNKGSAESSNGRNSQTQTPTQTQTSARQRIQQLQNELKEKETEIQLLSQNVGKIKTDYEYQLESKNADISRLSEANRILQEAHEQERGEHWAEVLRMKELVERVEREKAKEVFALKDRVNTLEMAVADADASAADRINALELTIEKLRDDAEAGAVPELLELRAKAADLEAAQALAAQKLEEMDDERNRLREQLVAAQSTIAVFEERSLQLQAAVVAETSTTTEDVEEEAEERSVPKTEDRALLAAEAEVRSAPSPGADEFDSSELISNELKWAREQLNKAIRARDALQNQVDSLEAEAHTLRFELDKTLSELETKRTEITTLELSLDESKRLMEMKEAELRAVRTDSAARIRALEQELASFKAATGNGSNGNGHENGSLEKSNGNGYSLSDDVRELFSEGSEDQVKTDSELNPVDYASSPTPSPPPSPSPSRRPFRIRGFSSQAPPGGLQRRRKKPRK